MKVDLNNVELVRPKDGFMSLHQNLWKAYSIARNRGYTDLGTHVVKPNSDHAYNPARAFDIGRKDRFFNKGFRYVKAAILMRFYVKHAKELDIDYVILGMVIWSRSKGWHRYRGDRSHMFHMHVSMWWKGKHGT